MKAPLIFCSTSHSINVQKIFKIVLSKVRSPVWAQLCLDDDHKELNIDRDHTGIRFEVYDSRDRGDWRTFITLLGRLNRLVTTPTPSTSIPQLSLGCLSTAVHATPSKAQLNLYPLL